MRTRSTRPLHHKYCPIPASTHLDWTVSPSGSIPPFHGNRRQVVATTRLPTLGPHQNAPSRTTNTKRTQVHTQTHKHTHTLKVVKQSDTCSASSLAGSRMIATGVRLPAPPWSRDGAASFTSSTAACSGEADARGVAPRDPAKGVVKSNDACGDVVVVVTREAR